MSENQIRQANIKWLTGLAATTSMAQAATVQITQVGNEIALTSLSTSSNNLSASVTVDNIDDALAFTGINANPGAVPSLSLTINGVNAFLSYTVSTGSSAYFARLGAQTSFSSSPVSLFQLVPLTFTDANINGGATTNGFLEINARNINGAEHAVTLTRLIFDDSSTTAPVGVAANDPAYPEFGAVPEPASLALLALGAAGVITRRQRREDV